MWRRDNGGGCQTLPDPNCFLAESHWIWSSWEEFPTITNSSLWLLGGAGRRNKKGDSVVCSIPCVCTQPSNWQLNRSEEKNVGFGCRCRIHNLHIWGEIQKHIFAIQRCKTAIPKFRVKENQSKYEETVVCTYTWKWPVCDLLPPEFCAKYFTDFF